MKNKIAIVVSSKEEAKQKEEFIQMLKDTCGCEYQLYFAYNAVGKSLTEVYNDFLNNKRLDEEIFVFIHDDIKFLKKNWGNEVLRLFNEHSDYGIIGVAGSSTFGEEGMWWKDNTCYGQILHRKDDKSWLTAFSDLYNEDLKETCTVDGLFIAVDRNRISNSFDTDFEGFNFYDISFCISNYIEGKCKIGVTTKIRIEHRSLGILKSEWFKNHDLLNKKYSNYFPLNVNRDSHKRDKNTNKLIIKEW